MPIRTPSEILQTATDAGCKKAAATNTGGFSRLLAGSFSAGAFIALGGALALAIGYGVPDIALNNPGIQRLLAGLVFPVGLMLTVVMGADLFTGNNALLIPPMLDGKLSPAKVLLNWALVWLGNFAGALAVAYFLIYLPDTLSASPYTEAICRMGTAKISASPWAIFLKGIGANWCVCLAVWLALSGRRLGEKLLACEVPVFAFVALGFEHCVANMFFIPLAMMHGADIGIYDMLAGNLLPATLGNIAGGAVFVGGVQWWLQRPRN